MRTSAACLYFLLLTAVSRVSAVAVKTNVWFLSWYVPFVPVRAQNELMHWWSKLVNGIEEDSNNVTVEMMPSKVIGDVIYGEKENNYAGSWFVPWHPTSLPSKSATGSTDVEARLYVQTPQMRLRLNQLASIRDLLMTLSLPSTVKLCHDLNRSYRKPEQVHEFLVETVSLLESTKHRVTNQLENCHERIKDMMVLRLDDDEDVLEPFFTDLVKVTPIHEVLRSLQGLSVMCRMFAWPKALNDATKQALNIIIFGLKEWFQPVNTKTSFALLQSLRSYQDALLSVVDHVIMQWLISMHFMFMTRYFDTLLWDRLMDALKLWLQLFGALEKMKIVLDQVNLESVLYQWTISELTLEEETERDSLFGKIQIMAQNFERI